MKNIICIIFIFITSNCIFINAQGTIEDSLKQKNEALFSIINAKEKVTINYFHLANPKNQIEYGDTSLNLFHQYDPTRKREIDFLTTGNGASSAYPIVYEYQHKRGFDAGFNGYNIYQTTLENYKVYESSKSFSDLFFSPLAGQDNFITSAKYSQPFRDGISLSIDYQRLNYKGFYRNQEAKNTNFGISLKYEELGKRYSFILTHISNVNEEEHNGGIDTSTFQNSFQSNRMNVSVLLSNAESRNQQKVIDLRNYYKLSNDSTNWDIKLQLGLTNNKKYYKFYDKGTDSSNDTLIYQDFLIENRGLRRYYKVNTLSISPGFTISNSNKIKLNAELIYDRNTLNLEGYDKNVQDLTLSSGVGLNLNSYVKINGLLELGLGDNAGNLLLQGGILSNIKNAISLEGQIKIYRRNISLIEERLIANGTSIYENNFDKPFGTTLSGKVTFPKLKMRIDISQTALTNAVYWDENQLANQLDESYLATSIQLHQQVEIYKFGLELNGVYQIFNKNLYHLPSYFVKPNLYYTNYFFDKKLNLRLGIESRLMESHQSKIYQPLLGQFFITNERVDFFPATDFYITAMVDQFRFFLRFENVSSFFTNNIYYQFPFQPQNDNNIRLGVRWTLFD